MKRNEIRVHVVDFGRTFLEMPSIGLEAVTCFRFFGQEILLFWTAGGELSDVEEQFREAW